MSATVSGITRVGHSLTISPDVDIAADVYFPVNHSQVRDLLGKILTHIDALGLPETQGKAAKDLVRQSINIWYDNAQENSLSSYRGCIAPIEVLRDGNGADRKYVWHGEGNHAVSVA